MLNEARERGQQDIEFIHIYRPNLLEDGLERISRLLSNQSDGFGSRRRSLSNKLSVLFMGEAGVDVGGLTSDFYTALWKAIVSAEGDTSLFESNGGKCLPRSGTLVETQRIQLRSVGILLAKTLYDGRSAHRSIGSAVFKFLRGVSPTLKDLDQFDPAIVTQKLAPLQAMRAHQFTERLGFSLDFGDVGGDNAMEVTDANKAQYIKEHIQHVTITTRREALDAIKGGFEAALNSLPRGVQDALRLPPSELQALACGDSLLLPGQVLPLLRFRGFPNGSPLPGWIRQIVGSKESHWLRALLEFSTGSDSLPLPPQPDDITFVASHGASDQQLPTAHTCFNTIDTPLYPSLEVVETKLSQSVGWASGFAFA
uniref:HECT-type E3 ubiquitin transferase n=1 Tax=Haptolina ericina TaxID=156174 RepID=A0A7S3ANL2_9EUKA